MDAEPVIDDERRASEERSKRLCIARALSYLAVVEARRVESRPGPSRHTRQTPSLPCLYPSRVRITKSHEPSRLYRHHGSLARYRRRGLGAHRRRGGARALHYPTHRQRELRLTRGHGRSASVFTNKYCEGYPGKRYYLGQEFTDAIELLTLSRAKDLFGADHTNVQPYSGSPANFAAYLAVADAGDKIMGMDLPHGGHLTHGWKVSFSGKLFEAEHYKVDKETERIDYDALRDHAKAFRPKILIAGHSPTPASSTSRRSEASLTMSAPSF